MPTTGTSQQQQQQINDLRDATNNHGTQLALINQAIQNLSQAIQTLTQQGEKFAEAINNFNVVVAQMQSQNNTIGKVVTAVVGIGMLIIGAIVGQYIHLH